MPETSDCEHLIDYLFRVGPGTPNGIGYVGVSFAEILSWSQLSKVNLTGWESETLHAMSRAYCGQLSISNKKDSVPPWKKVTQETLESSREKIAKGTLEAFRSISVKKPAKKRSS